MKKTATQALWQSFSALCLHDDFSPLSIDQGLTLSEGLRQLIRAAKANAVPAKVVPKAQQAQTVSLGGASAKSSRLFRSESSLREMMEEYNRPRANSRTLIKANQSRGFESMPFELIRIPSIPGKILRPA